MSGLTGQQQREPRRQLLALRLVLEARADASTPHTQPVSFDQPSDRPTRMNAIQQQRMALRQQQRVEGELQQVS